MSLIIAWTMLQRQSHLRRLEQTAAFAERQTLDGLGVEPLVPYRINRPRKLCGDSIWTSLNTLPLLPLKNRIYNIRPPSRNHLKIADVEQAVQRASMGFPLKALPHAQHLYFPISQIGQNVKKWQWRNHLPTAGNHVKGQPPGLFMALAH